MYESAPTAREGERIDELVPEAIDATANVPAERPAYDARGSENRLHQEGMVRLLLITVAVETLLIVAMLIGWIF